MSLATQAKRDYIIQDNLICPTSGVCANSTSDWGPATYRYNKSLTRYTNYPSSKKNNPALDGVVPCVDLPGRGRTVDPLLCPVQILHYHVGGRGVTLFLCITLARYHTLYLSGCSCHSSRDYVGYRLNKADPESVSWVGWGRIPSPLEN